MVVKVVNRVFSRLFLPSCCVSFLFLALVTTLTTPSLCAAPSDSRDLAKTPPMGWNDWAHYQCNFNAQTILGNAKALVDSGLAKRGYDTVTIDDCWMLKNRDTKGNLQVDPHRFPSGMKTVADAIHGMGLKFGIYEDAGYATCGGYAGSGEPNGGGKDHFLQDAQLFASWGVDYLKLDGCNVYSPDVNVSKEAYRKAYAAQNRALHAVHRPIVFSESAPAYFQGMPEWYDVLSWVGAYGELWREGADIDVFQSKKPDAPRFASILWNYTYNLELGRFQKPHNWNDADFVIGGDGGVTMPETRSQMALWSMMSAPLILSSDLGKLTPEAKAVLGNRSLIKIDQDPLGIMATLVERSAALDVLMKPLSGGDDAVAVLNRDGVAHSIHLTGEELGLTTSRSCRFDVQDLWTGTNTSAQTEVKVELPAHDTAIWRLHLSSECSDRPRVGTITMINPGSGDHVQTVEAYTKCLSASGQVAACHSGTGERWAVGENGTLTAEGKCLTAIDGKATMQACSTDGKQRWTYTRVGNLVAKNGECLSATTSQTVHLAACGHNLPNQIWSLPNK